MRRAHALAVIAIPAMVFAAVSAGSGQVVEVDNFDARVGSSYINAAQCAGTAPLRLEWNIVPLSGDSFVASGTHRIFASNSPPPTSDANANFCPEVDDPNASPQVFADQVDSASASTAVQQKDVSGALVAGAANFACDTGSEEKVVYLCSHWYDASSTRRGHASGRFIVQLRAPASPTNVSPGSGDGSLDVSWTASDPNQGAEADHYVAEATPVGGGPVFSAATADATTSVTIRGLTNFTDYEVVVRAFSVGGNPSEPSDPAVGTPLPSAGFWDAYKERGGVEAGGCRSGSAGALALLATGLLVLRRRKR